MIFEQKQDKMGENCKLSDFHVALREKKVNNHCYVADKFTLSIYHHQKFEKKKAKQYIRVL